MGKLKCFFLLILCFVSTCLCRTVSFDKDFADAAQLESRSSEDPDVPVTELQEDTEASFAAVSERSTTTPAAISDQNMMTIFKDVFQKSRADLTNVKSIIERYIPLRGDVSTMCARGNRVACDLNTVFRQLMILKGMADQIHSKRVRSLLDFKELLLTKYLEQLKLSRQFRDLLTHVRFDMSTIITVTHKVSTGLNSYLTAMASFDKAIGTADMGFISGRISQIKSGSKQLWDYKVSTSLDVILRAALMALSAEVIERTAAVAVEIFTCCNPAAVLAGNCDAGEILDRITALQTAIKKLGRAGRLLTGLNTLKATLTSITQKFAKNDKQLKDIKNILDTFDKASDTEKRSKAKVFIDKYGAYTPHVTNQDLAGLSAALEYTASAGCELISEAGGVSGNVLGTIVDNSLNYCGTIGGDLAELESFYEDLYSFQFELIDSFVKIVRSDIAAVYSSAISSSTTQLNVRPMVIGLLMDEIKIQRAARAVCDELEYRAAGSMPPHCKMIFFTDGALQALISYSRTIPTSKVTHYAYIPSEPSKTLNDKTFLDIDRLMKGKSVYFSPPYQDVDWLKTYKWIPKDYDPETGFYIERMDLFIPGIKCQEGDNYPMAASVEVSNQKTVRIHQASISPSYLLPSRTSTFVYEDNSAYCQPCSEIIFPIKENSKPNEIKAQKALCVKSEGQVPKCQSISFPSLFSTWKIRLVPNSCTLVKDTRLGYKPMVTVALTKVEVKAPTDECWPNPCQYGGTCIDGLMDFTCNCKSPMTGKLCNEVKSGFQGSSPDACDMTTNIALNRPSQQSSVYYLSGQMVYLRASFGNDGNTKSNDLGKCTHTKNENQPFWYVKLPPTHKVCAVKITNRGDSASAAARLGEAKVVISDRKPSLSGRVETLCGTVKSNPGNGEVLTITCTKPIPSSKGHYLTLYLPKTEALHICDFQAFTTRATSPALSTTPSGWKTCDWNTNIVQDTSKRKDVAQSSDYKSRGGEALRAVDNSYENHYWYKCSHTKIENQPWFAIEFHQKQTICGVKIFQRIDEAAQRSAYARVGVMDKIPRLGMAAERAKFKLCGTLPGEVWKGDLNTVECELFPVEGTTVVIYSPSTTALNLCEVEVYATK